MAGIFGKSEEEREIQKVEKEKRAWLQSPLGKATVAKENGNGFFEIELEIAISTRTVVFGSGDFAFGKNKKSDYTELLSQIESIGWRLEHVGYYFMITGEESRDKFLASGQHTAVKGKTMGVYLFRNVVDS
jgi:hypothetical protein